MKQISILALLLSTLTFADTPPQIINKTCPSSQWFKSIVPGQVPTCTQPGYSDLSGSAPASAWGTIIGTLSNQTDLQSALNAKQAGPLTGDVVTSGTTATIQPGVVSFAKFQDINTGKLLGRSNASTGPPAEISVGSGLSLSAGTLSATSSGSVTDVTATAPIASTGGATPNISLNNTAVTPGSYTSTNITVDSKGRITAASNGSGGSGSPGGASGTVQYNDSGSFGGVVDSGVNSAKGSVGLGTTVPEARLHSKAASSILSAPSSAASLVSESTLSNGISASATIIYQPLNVPFTSSSQIPGSGGYVANGQTVNASVYSYRIVDGTKYAVPGGGVLVSFTDTINDGTTLFSIDWQWSAAVNADGSPVDGYFITIDSLGSLDLGNVTNYVDDGITSGSAPVIGFTGIVDSGQSYTFNAYQQGTSPSGGTYYSLSGTNYGASTISSGALFVISHSISGAVSPGYAIEEVGTGTATFSQTATTVIQNSDYFGPSLTFHYGIFSDGSNLSLNFSTFARQTSPSTYYSINGNGTSTSDPNDGNYYSIHLTQSLSAGSNSFKIIRNTTTGLITSATAVDLDSFGPNFSDGTVTTPASIIDTAGIFENAASDSNARAQLAVRSNSVSNPNNTIEFQDSAGTARGSLSINGSDIFKLKTPGTFGFYDSASTYIAGLSDTGYLSLAGAAVGTTNYLTLPAPNSSHSQIRLTGGTMPSTPTTGAINFNGSNFFGTGLNTINRGFVQTATTALLTATTIPLTTTNGFLTDSGLVYTPGVQFTVPVVTLFQQGLAIGDAKDITFGTGTGTKFGTSAFMKIGFFGATPVAQPGNNSGIDTALANLGLRATGGTAIFATKVSGPAGTSGVQAKFGGRLTQSTTQATSASTTETDLHSYTIAANTLSTNGDVVKFRSSGTFAATAFTKELRVKFGGTTILDTGALAITAGTNWVVEGECIRVSSGNQKCSSTFTSSSSVLNAFAQYTATSITDTASIILKTTGQVGTTGGTDIAEETFKVEYFPAF